MIVAPNARRHTPQAFLTNGAQGINLHRGTWHGVLTPLHAPGLFAVVDRIGATPNLEEHRFTEPLDGSCPLTRGEVPAPNRIAP